MTISSGGAIAIAIVIALCAVIIGAAVHHTVTNKDKPFDENGVPRPADWAPNQYPEEQLKHLDRVRWLTRRGLWAVANEVRQSRGQGPPDWYPGDEWIYAPDRETTSGSSTRAIARNVALFRRNNSDVLEQDVINNPANLEQAYRSVAYLADDSPDSDEDDYGMPATRNRPPTQSGMPDMVRRWTQHGAPRQSQHEFDHAYPMSRITPNDCEFDDFDEDYDLAMHRPIEPESFPRNSSVYSARTVDHMPRIPAGAFRIPPESTASTARTRTSRKSPGPERSRTHDIIAQWESANGAFS